MSLHHKLCVLVFMPEGKMQAEYMVAKETSSNDSPIKIVSQDHCPKLSNMTGSLILGMGEDKRQRANVVVENKSED
jgi:hypothetical protein